MGHIGNVNRGANLFGGAGLGISISDIVETGTKAYDAWRSHQEFESRQETEEQKQKLIEQQIKQMEEQRRMNELLARRSAQNGQNVPATTNGNGGTPKWILPALIGGGLLLAFFMMGKAK